MDGKKVIIVTGASDGIGKAIALELGKQGNQLILISRNEEKLKEVSSKIKDSRYFICDIADYARIKDIVAKLEKVYGGIDVLVNNAGIWIEGELDKSSPEDIRRAFEVNTLGQIYVTRAAIPLMKKQRSGLIINIISQAGLRGKAERSVYTASKFAMTGLTKSIQPELAKYGIRVTGIYPGKVNTALFSKSGIEKKMNGAILPEDVAQAVSWVVSRPVRVSIPELGIKDVEN